ncbi:hypothetical protein [Bailinhaonella thermotolerans]|uniref:hypothetical protein n=1 Tax=Bailinhaonella thermotolerans TaxID=1070861 RepID=UPI00192A3804|nr:hypothetical protein [Bailinhaonella thermotolerans]
MARRRTLILAGGGAAALAAGAAITAPGGDGARNPAAHATARACGAGAAWG